MQSRSLIDAQHCLYKMINMLIYSDDLGFFLFHYKQQKQAYESEFWCVLLISGHNHQPGPEQLHHKEAHPARDNDNSATTASITF